MNTLNKKRTLQAFKTGDEKQLYSVTKEFFESGFFNCYLTPQQFNLLHNLLESDEQIWKSFMKGSLILRFKEDAGDDSNSNENMYMKPGYPTLRNLNSTIRYLLYEKAIDYFYSEDIEDSSEYQLLEKINYFEDDKDIGNEKSTNDHDKLSSEIPNKNLREDDDDDDYDDDDDEEEVEKEKNNDDKLKEGKKVAETHVETGEKPETLIIDDITKDYVLLVSKEELLQKPDYPFVPEITADEEALEKMVHPILGTSSAIESSMEKQNELKLIKNFNKIYHSFENDLPNIHKRRKLERSDKQLEMADENIQNKNIESEGNDTDTKQVNKLMTLGGAMNLSLKNLLNKIEESRDKLGITDLELKNLIMDVRKNRSKWANYNKIGQEELYEACDKVVTELRGYTEHSTPFLNRVSKREAPNYYQIIKHPMDLNTVLKKLKTLQYQNKKQFVDDLMLIWQNCLTYNSDPKHYIRLDAIAMRKKTLMLTPLIPDITIRDRAEVEKEAAELALKEKEKEKEKDDNLTTRRTSTRGMGYKKTKKGRKGTQNEESVDSIVATPKEDSITETKESATPSALSVADGQPLSAISIASERLIEEGTETPSNMEDEEDEHMEDVNQRDIITEEVNEDNEDLEMSTWKTLTSNTRYKLCNERSNLFKDNKIQPEVEALLRTKGQMFNFSKYLENESKIVLHRNRKYFDESDDPYLIEYDVVGGVPNIKHKSIDFDKVEEEILEKMITEGKTLENLPDSKFKVQLKGSNGLILENIGLMQDIRKVCFKINLIRTMQSSQFVHQSQLVAPSFPRIKFEDIDPMSKLKTRDQMTENIASLSLQKSVSALVMMSGFQSTAPFCTKMLTEVAESYMSNLAKTMKLHLESKSINKIRTKDNKPLNYKDILQLVLKYNGIEKPDIIYSFYKEQLTKQNKKLVDLKYGLENFLRDLLRPSIQDLSETQFSDNSEQFVNGDFSDEIGEDFFGFKELGLDKEFGLLTSNIPLHLLQSKLSYQFSQMNKNMVRRIYSDLDEVSFPKLRKKDIPNQIGLLQPYYDQLLEKSKVFYNKHLKKYQAQKATDGPVDEFEEINDEDDLILIEDDDLPLKQRNNRPKIPPNGKITQTKKRVASTAFFLETQKEIEERLPSILKKYEEEGLRIREKAERAKGETEVLPETETKNENESGNGNENEADKKNEAEITDQETNVTDDCKPVDKDIDKENSNENEENSPCLTVKDTAIGEETVVSQTKEKEEGIEKEKTTDVEQEKKVDNTD